MQPATGTLKPQEEIKVAMTFRAAREVALRANADMKLIIVEAQTKSSVPIVPIRVTANAVFSKFRVLPASGINFGPMELETAKQKKLEIYNDGEFDFEYKLVAVPKAGAGAASKDGDRPSTASTAAAAAGAAKPAAGKADPKAAPAAAAAGGKGPELAVGAFSLSPAVGTIPKGGKVVIDIRYAVK